MRKFLDKVKCLSGYHDERLLGFSKPFYQQSLSKCTRCNKFKLYHYGINCGCWSKDTEHYPKEAKEYIKENKEWIDSVK